MTSRNRLGTGAPAYEHIRDIEPNVVASAAVFFFIIADPDYYPGYWPVAVNRNAFFTKKVGQDLEKSIRHIWCYR